MLIKLLGNEAEIISYFYTRQFFQVTLIKREKVKLWSQGSDSLTKYMFKNMKLLLTVGNPVNKQKTVNL